MARRKKLRVPDSFDKVYATQGQIQATKSEIKFLEQMLEKDAKGSQRISDVKEVQQEIQKKQSLLNEHTPKKLRGQRANRMYAEAKQLKQEIAEAMPSNKDYFRPYPKNSDGHNRQMDFEKAVNQQIAFQTNPVLQQKVRRFKAIMSRIDPSNPTIRNIESLRR